MLKTLVFFLSSALCVTAFNVPPHCSKFNDGCHECAVSGGEPSSCTEQACFVNGPEYCMKYEAGFESDCQDMCIDIWEPLCAQTAGRNRELTTFGNLCQMESWLCHHAGTEMSVLEFGQTCEELHPNQPHIPELDNPEDNPDPDCFSACIAVYAPVCGSDGVTYGSSCELENIHRCVSGKGSLTLAYTGPCAPDVPENGVGVQQEPIPDVSMCNQVCAEIYQPVCGSNSVTYSNACELDRAACFSRNSIRFAHSGPCEDVELPEGPAEETCNKMCTREWAPVCGSDGKTRSNPCELAMDACLAASREQTSITLKHTGECTAEDFVVPAGCEVFFDGCRECIMNRDGTMGACEKKMCAAEDVTAPACRSFFRN